MTEKEHIEAAQDALGELKANLRAIKKINEDAGRSPAANAAMKVLGKVIVLHAEAMEELEKHWPEEISGEISTRGGGGR